MQLKLPLQVYLDSSDFSVLSDPQQLNESTIKLRDLFLEYSEKSLVQFRFSIAHVSEVAPLGAHAQQAAERRAALIYRLCGSNALVTTQEIQEAELSQVTGFSPMSSGRWYPAIDELLPKSLMPEFKSILTDELRAKGMTRMERRRSERAIFKHGRLSKTARHAMNESIAPASGDFLSQLPFTPHEFDSVKNFVIKGTGRDAASAAFHRILSNPTWIITAFAGNSVSMKNLTDWIRLGGSDFVRDLSIGIKKARDFNQLRVEQDKAQNAALSEITDLNQRKRTRDQSVQQSQSLDSLIKRTTGEREHKILVSLLMRHGVSDKCTLLTPEQLRTLFPGIASAVSAGVHVFNKALETPHKDTLIPSDFGDVMHAFYAPYMDIFRTDRFMADGLKRILLRNHTEVSSKLSELPALIEKCLLKRAASSLPCSLQH